MEPAEHAPAEHAPAEHAPAEHAIVAQGAYPMVRELQQLLARADIPAAILRPPAHGGGWGTKLSLAVASEHGAAAAAVIERSFLDSLAPEARPYAEASIDLDSAVNACPACGERLFGLPARCTSCGLRLV